AFAAAVDPNNNDIKAHIAWVTAQRANGLPSLPTNIVLERQINPFLRPNLAHMCHHLPPLLACDTQHPSDNFSVIRAWKDEL
ncbi:hydroxyacylglutathione hydrolase, partial [Pseudoalteromonas citrea]